MRGIEANRVGKRLPLCGKKTTPFGFRVTSRLSSYFASLSLDFGGLSSTNAFFSPLAQRLLI